jgi:hypothetical protein
VSTTSSTGSRETPKHSRRCRIHFRRWPKSLYDAAFAHLVELAATIDDEIREIIFQAIA